MHRAVVCPQSSFLDKALNSDFTEGVTGVVTLHEETDHVRRMLNHLYGIDDALDDYSTIQLVDLYAAMHKYFVAGFTAFIVSRIEVLARHQIKSRDLASFVALFLHTCGKPDLEVNDILKVLKQIAKVKIHVSHDTQAKNSIGTCDLYLHVSQHLPRDVGI